MTPSPTVAYDANGNTLSDPSGKSYSWDFENRLTQAVVPGTNGGTTTFKYDPFGRRIQKSGPLGTTNYLYDGDKILEELNSGGTVLSAYTDGQNLDEPLAELRSGTASYYQVDGLGSVTSLTNSSSMIADSYTYDGFGNLSASMGSITNPLRYAGRESDSETGLYYYRARYYSPDIGRFVNEDPLGLSVGVNVYEYVRNNPIDGIDPLGLYAYCFFNQIGGGIICYSDSGDSMGDPNAYSGYGSAANNPAWATWYGVGEIPEGDYWIGPGYDGDKGKPQFDLTPVKDPFMHKPDMTFHDPKSYLMHADNQNHPGPHEASEGCIVTSLKLRRWVAKQGGGIATVYNPQHFLYPLDRFLSNPLALP